MIPRWWRVAVWFEEPNGDLFTQTFHVSAVTERKARSLVGAALEGREHTVYVCHPSDPMNNSSREEFIAASYGPYQRHHSDPGLAPLLREEEGAQG